MFVLYFLVYSSYLKYLFQINWFYDFLFDIGVGFLLQTLVANIMYNLLHGAGGAVVSSILLEIVFIFEQILGYREYFKYLL